ncbi:MAG: LptA/OstA family protein [Acidobacteriaceae bacterium]|nr:LptA/OstA family protein [Acidobacteriaceae bacterium]
MRLSVDRLRWVLIAGAALLLAVVAGFVGYGRWKALKTFHELVKHSGVTITHETNGFTYSQTLKGRTIFTLHAAKALQRSDGKWTLRDAELTLFGKSGERTDHIYGAEFEYDPEAGIAKAMGQVHMDLEAPQGMNASTSQPLKIRGKEGRSPSALRGANENMHTIHVLTSGLVYLRKLGVAATQEDVAFSFAGMEAHARGAEFDEADSVVHLLANVRLDGDLRGQPVHLTATKADLDRGHQLATLQQPTLESDGKHLKSALAVIRMRKNGSVDTATATGDVVLTSGMQVLRGSELTLTMNEEAEPKLAVMTGGVTLVDISATRPMQGASQRAELAFNAAGQARELTATGAARLTAKESGLDRSIAGNRVVVELTAERSGSKQTQVSGVHAVGDAMAEAESLAAKTGVRRRSTLRADDLQAAFATGAKTLARQVVGTGHARLEQMASNGEVQNSSAESVTMLFTPNGQMSSAVETGHVLLRSQGVAKKGKATVSTASAEHAVYDALAQTLHLTGNANVAQNETQLTAREIVMRGQDDDAEATGDVLATISPEKAASGTTRESSHVTADHATMSRGGEFAVFTGSDAKPARLWQGGSQLQAAVLTMDGKEHMLMARPASKSGHVLAVFANTAVSSGAGKGKSAGGLQATRITSAALDYSDLRGEAVFTGGVRMLASGGDVRSDRATVFFSSREKGKASALAAADPAGRALDRAVMSSNVRLTQPGRTGTADQLLYTAATETFVLTGTAAKRPHVVDTQQGNVTGTTLLFSAADSTIVVAGEGKGRNRVRTEIGVQPEPGEGRQ